MAGRVEVALQRWVVATNRSLLRHLWRAVYAVLARGAAAWLARGVAATVYLTGSLARGEAVYGLSDIDLVVVVSDRLARPEVRRRLEVMHARLPVLRRVIAHVWIYDEPELEAAAAASYPTFGLDEGRAAFTGESALPDAMGLLDRPGLSPPEGWRRLRGAGLAPATVRGRQDERLAAWLEIQYQLRWALPVLAQPEPLDHKLAGALGGVARAWLRLVHDEITAGTRSALGQAGWRLRSEREVLWLASHVIQTGRCDASAARELWGCLVRLAARVAEQIEAELAYAPSTEVCLAGAGSLAGLPLLDWCGLALPAVQWPAHGPPTSAEPHFVLAPGDAADAGSVMGAFTPEPWGTWGTLRHGPLLIRPTLAVWEHGRLRTAELPSSDPVSFALLGGDSVARFPQVRGWSARDRARRAVAEHRAWLFASVEHGEAPGWVGGRPAANWDTPATRSLLLSAARAALFLESLEDGEPLLALDHEATVEAWGRRDPFAAEAAQLALRGLRQGTEAAQHYEELVALLDSVHRMSPYVAPAERTQARGAGMLRCRSGPNANTHNGSPPMRLAAFPRSDKNPYLRLLYGALSQSGIHAVAEPRLGAGWLWQQRTAVTFLHFHWDKFYAENTSEDPRWRGLRSWVKLIRFALLLGMSRALGYRILWTVHEVVPHESRSRRRDLLAAKLLARASHAVMAHDDATRSRAKELLGMNGREVTVIPHGSYVGVYPHGRSRAAVRREWGLGKRDLVFVAFGNLRSYKRLELLLDAFSMLDEPEVALVIAGEFLWRFRQPEWEQRVTARLEAAAQRDPRIRYRVERVPDHGVAELHAACDIAVMARSDGWTSGSMILALSHGLPVVAARQPAYEELLNGDAAGWLYEPGCASSLAQALSAAARARDRVPDKAREARRRAQELSWDEVAARTAAVMRSSLSRS
jgi:beta-1,4-mannosyltransferase